MNSYYDNRQLKKLFEPIWRTQLRKVGVLRVGQPTSVDPKWQNKFEDELATKGRRAEFVVNQSWVKRPRQKEKEKEAVI